MSALVLTPPASLAWPARARSVFLAGSIEMGDAPAWQDEVARALGDIECVVLNPRRKEWDATWAQSITDARFRDQVEWELTAQERADVIAMYFAPETRAPITLLELGLFVRTGRVLACCPDGFWRKGNVEIVCARYGAPLLPSLSALVSAVRARLTD